MKVSSQKKYKILSNFNNNRILTIKSEKFSNLPLQQQLLVIEELNLQKIIIFLKLISSVSLNINIAWLMV